MDRDNTYKKDILDAIKKIEEDVAGSSFKVFFDTHMIHDAVIRELLIVGEASKRLSEEFKNARPDTPWKKIAGTRDILVHDYGSVDLDEVWKIVNDDLPALKSALK